jgi:hypothetical protein
MTSFHSTGRGGFGFRLVVVLRIVSFWLGARLALLDRLRYPYHLAHLAIESNDDVIRYWWEREGTEGL